MKVAIRSLLFVIPLAACSTDSGNEDDLAKNCDRVWVDLEDGTETTSCVFFDHSKEEDGDESD